MDEMLTMLKQIIEKTNETFNYEPQLNEDNETITQINLSLKEDNNGGDFIALFTGLIEQLLTLTDGYELVYDDDKNNLTIIKID